SSTPSLPRRRAGRAWRTSGRSRRLNGRGKQNRMYAWHDLLFERHANGPPSGPDLSYHAASWPTRLASGNASELSQGTKLNISRISRRFHITITRRRTQLPL